MSLIKTFLAFKFRASTNQLGLHSFLPSLGCCNLRLCLIDTRQRSVYPRILQLALAEIFLNAATRSLNCRLALIDLGLIVIILQFDEEIALVNLLVVSRAHRAHDACHLGAERGKVAANVSIIRDLLYLSAFPCVPVTRDGDHNGHSEKHHENWSYVALPPGTLARHRLICADFWRHRFRYGRRGSIRHWRGGH